MSHPASDSQWPRVPLPPLPQCWALSSFLSSKTCSQKHSFLAPVSFSQPGNPRPREGLGGITQLPAPRGKALCADQAPRSSRLCAASLGTAAPRPARSNLHHLLPPKRETGLHLNTNESCVMETRRSSWGIQGLESGSLREGLVRPALCRVRGCVYAVPSTLPPSPRCPFQPEAGPDVRQPKQSLDREREVRARPAL